MRLLVLLAILMVSLFGLSHYHAVEAPPKTSINSQPPTPWPVDQWRRTSRGWEHTSQWPVPRPPPKSPPRAAKLHPLVFGSLILMLSVAALVGLSPDAPREP